MDRQMTGEERRRTVCLIRDWLESEPRISVEDIQRKLLASGMQLSTASVFHYRYKARVLLNRELLFGPDAERMFPKGE
jgi:hypothetical protein